MATAEKVATVAELKEKISRGRAIVVADYRGLNVKSLTLLRRNLRDVGAELKVAKNTLVRRAAAEVNVDALDQFLTGPSALAFGYDDPVSAAKVMTEFAKTNTALKIKGAVVEGRTVDEEGVKAVASLPPREVLIAQVLAGFQSPISGLVGVLQGTLRKFVYTLDAIREQKQASA